jgi:hypothetical protein
VFRVVNIHWVEIYYIGNGGTIEEFVSILQIIWPDLLDEHGDGHTMFIDKIRPLLIILVSDSNV